MTVTKLFAILLVVILPIVQTSVVMQCYTCAGYIPKLPVNDTTNNPYCVSESFKASEVPKLHSKSGYCVAETVRAEGIGELTVRYGDQGVGLRDDYVYTSSYVCKGNLCNDKPTSSAGTPLLLLPLLMIPVVLSRLLA
ncbi:uncharacterized protein LOC125031762 [Penaeus chinensis]|uniref:uncharacterized protein LOC125031762 n=1 Tax=Penaeus chinensis TaxID=139456 RepID=UPI001FB7DDC4|nr:uncharacterized protein LOC125031762 [Penaeus chinensis]